MPHRFTHRHGGGHRHVERAQAFSHRNDEPRVGGCVHLLGHARRFAAEQQDVAAPERVREIRAARARGEENEPRAGTCAPSLERLPVDVTDDLDMIEVIHTGAAKRTVAGRKARGLDDVRLEAEAGGETKNRARVLGNVGLKQRNAHGPSFRACSEP